MKKIAVIGSTGSIGKQVLSVVRRNPDKFKIVSLAAGSNVELLCEQIKEFSPSVATLSSQADFPHKEFCKKTQLFFGKNAFTSAIIPKADIVVIALVGFTGIIAVLDAIEKRKNVALANKESLVVGGDLVTKKAKEAGITITPIDSEHSAVWQALNFDFKTPFSKIILTASGGAFRDYSKAELSKATAKDALRHPNWNMGAKITVDCATLANKAFEVIEAKWLYDTSFDKIDIIIHRESIIHSMVEFIDGVTIAQLAYPTMEIPIQLALEYPNRFPSATPGVNFKTLKSLTFSEYDEERFPCFKLILDAAKKGGAFPAVANGANERAVGLFLQDKIGYDDIYKCIDGALSAFDGGKSDSFDALKAADDFAARYVKKTFGD